MKLLPLDTPELLELVAQWLALKENHQWLDFGNGRQVVTPTLLKVMAQRPTHFMRAYTSDQDDTPIGICGLNSVNLDFKSATLWGAAGDKLFRNRGLGTLAASKVMALAFRDLGLQTINTWVVEGNPSLRLVQRVGFQFIGRQRRCHFIDGRAYDRLLFDLLPGELKCVEEEQPPSGQKASFQPSVPMSHREEGGAGSEAPKEPAYRREMATAESGKGREA